MSEERTIFVGDFEVDPDLIPEPPKVPLGTPLVFEIVKGTRVTGGNDNGDRFVYNDLQCKAIDVDGTPSIFSRLWVTERFEGSPTRSWKHFLRICKLPYTTRAEHDLAGFKFKGTARVNKKRDDGAPELASVIGPA